MHTFPITTAILSVAALPAGAQMTVNDLCGRATMTAAAGMVSDVTFSYGGTDRYYCTYTPTSLNPVHPLVIALHGGDGNASQMMEDNHGIIATAESLGWIAVFPNGLPRPSCGGTLCLDNSWSAPDNVFFIGELIGQLKAGGMVDADRVYLVGFSGGAGLIYTIAGTPGFPHAINSIATVAGVFGNYTADVPDQGFKTIPLPAAQPVSALLAQGGADPKLPAAGGLDETTRESHASFRTKVDTWRLLTGTELAQPQPIDLPTLAPNAPADAEAVRYRHGGATVVEVLDPGLGHAWPSWDIMAVAAELFERN